MNVIEAAKAAAWTINAHRRCFWPCRLGFVLWARQDDLWHSHIGAAVRRAGGEILSAGFATVAGGVAKCWGMSESLGIASREDDSEALAEQLGLTTAA